MRQNPKRGIRKTSQARKLSKKEIQFRLLRKKYWEFSRTKTRKNKYKKIR